VPAACQAAGVATATTCAACKGVWPSSTSSTQPISNQKNAADRFIALNTYPVTLMGYMQYYGNCADKLTVPFTSNFATVQSKIDGTNAAGQASSIACAVSFAADQLISGVGARAGAAKFVLLVSDGITNRPTGDTKDLICQQCSWAGCCPTAEAELGAAVQHAKDLGVHISVIGMGSQTNTAFLQAIADGTGGLAVFEGTSQANQADLVAIYEDMVKNYKFGLTQ
jgi:Mg-chelatase subunit ChlD